VIRCIRWSELNSDERRAALARPADRSDPALVASVHRIIDDVRARGWPAVQQISKSIDGKEPELIEVAPLANRARRSFSPDFIAAMELAAANIGRFHKETRPQDMTVETMPGLKVSKCWRVVDRAGIYIPGGSAPLFSTLLMLALPARAAGVGSLTVVTPPRSEALHLAIALAADLCGLHEIWALGGAQAIAALAFGAGPIPRVDLICGPGNAWVACAKALVSSLPGGPRIDLPAGPSELMIIADEDADPALIAADLLSQAEHDPLAQVLLVTTSSDVSAKVVEELERQLASLPRADTARKALSSARQIITSTLAEAAEVANLYAPEHLSLAIADPENLVPLIRSAGAIFAGGRVAEVFGDYVAGSSHVLPTDGAARGWGGITTQTFMKCMTVQRIAPEAICRIAAPAALLAREEGLEGHARAAALRLGQAA
jgi:histidinol dehydrogenase